MKTETFQRFANAVYLTLSICIFLILFFTYAANATDALALLFGILGMIGIPVEAVVYAVLLFVTITSFVKFYDIENKYKILSITTTLYLLSFYFYMHPPWSGVETVKFYNNIFSYISAIYSGSILYFLYEDTIYKSE